MRSGLRLAFCFHPRVSCQRAYTSYATAVVLLMQVCPQISLRILDADYEEHNKTIKQIQVHFALVPKGQFDISFKSLKSRTILCLLTTTACLLLCRGSWSTTLASATLSWPAAALGADTCFQQSLPCLQVQTEACIDMSSGILA